MREFTTVKLLHEFKHRYKFMAKLYCLQQNTFDDVVIFMDVGCYNTLFPKRLAAISGHSLGFKRSYRLGGAMVEAEAFLIGKIMIGDVALKRVLVFATDLAGDFENDILLGTNVMNNWEMIIHKKSNTFKFREDPPEDLPNINNIYQNYFDNNGNYVYVQDEEVA